MRLGLGLQLGRRGGGWSPLALFAGGTDGAWYDPSDLSTLAQNSDGSTAVSVGDPVGYMADKSGNGNHATQSTAANRPVLRSSGDLYYLEFDGVTDSMDLPAIGFAGAQNRTAVWAGDNPAIGIGGGTGALFQRWSLRELDSKVRLEITGAGETTILNSTEKSVYSAVLNGDNLSDHTIYKNMNSIELSSSAAINTVEVGNAIGKAKSDAHIETNLYQAFFVAKAVSSMADLIEWSAQKAGVTL